MREFWNLILPVSLEKILFAGIDAVRPATLFPKILSDPYPELKDWLESEDRYLLCMGKAGISSAKSILDLAPCKDYFIVAPDSPDGTPFTVHVGSHPIPNEKSLHAGEELLEWLKRIPTNARLLTTLSGGASALVVSPAPGISIQSKMKVNDLLIRSGATIQEINTVRKHLSRIKGGQLARSVESLHCVVLVISDVIGNDLATIGSGPFYPDPTTFAAARNVLEKYDLWNRVPEEVRSVLNRGMQGKIPETPKPGSYREIPHYIIASNEIARRAATEKSRELSFHSNYIREAVSGPIDQVALSLISMITSTPTNSAIILGGEVTVRVQGNGTGGRNQHLSLLLTELIAGKKVLFCAAGTDGVDGNSPAAGAWIDGTTFERSRMQGLDLKQALRNFDSYPFFHSLHQDIYTGPTGTNVMDLYIALHLEE